MTRYEIMLGKGVPVLRPSNETVKPGLPLQKSFTLTPGQTRKFLDWSKKHKCIHSTEKRFQFAFKFMPTHVGTVDSVSCLCGTKTDLTDIDTFSTESIDIMSAENLDQIAILHGLARKHESDDDLRGRIMEQISGTGPETYELPEFPEFDRVVAVENQMRPIPPVISRSTHRMRELAVEVSVPAESLHTALDSAAMARDRCKHLLFDRLSEQIEYTTHENVARAETVTRASIRIYHRQDE